MLAIRNIIPAYRHAQRVIQDPEEFSDVISGASLVADFLHRNTAPSYIEQFQSPSWTLDFHDAHVKARVQCPLPQGWASLGFMRRATSSTFHGVAVKTGMIVCETPGHMIDGHIEPGFMSMAVNVPLSVWETCQSLAGIERLPFGTSMAVCLPPALANSIEHKLCAIRHLLRTASEPHLAAFAASEAADFATHMVTTTLELSATPASPSDSLRNRSRLARRAEDWMRDHLSQRIRIPDVCLAMRVSRRELEYAFRSTFDQTPLSHLHALRLNAIRRALRCAEGGNNTVINLALDHGITHLSRFAAQYHALFGEKPSATLRR